VFVSPSGEYFELSSRLEYFCTNNQVEYEALLFTLEILESMGVNHVEAFGDSVLIVHQVSEKYQCLDGSLNAYLDKRQDVNAKFDEFSIHCIYSPMFVDSENVEFLPEPGTEIGLIDRHTSLTGPSYADNINSVPQIANSATSELEEIKPKIHYGNKSITDYW
jgi:hypothetical protein